MRDRRPDGTYSDGTCSDGTCSDGTCSDGTYSDGMAVRREVLGDEHVDRSIARTNDFTVDFQDLITRYAWGEIWTRPGLDRRTRSCITLAMLAALRAHDELALHLRAALRNGLTPADIKEVLLQVAVYAGVPAANTAFAVAATIMAEVGQPTDPQAEDQRTDGAGSRDE